MLKENAPSMENTKRSNNDQEMNIMSDISMTRRKRDVAVRGSKFRRRVVKMQTTKAVTKAFTEAGNRKSQEQWKLLHSLNLI